MLQQGTYILSIICVVAKEHERSWKQEILYNLDGKGSTSTYGFGFGYLFLILYHTETIQEDFFLFGSNHFRYTTDYRCWELKCRCTLVDGPLFIGMHALSLSLCTVLLLPIACMPPTTPIAMCSHWSDINLFRRSQSECI